MKAVFFSTPACYKCKQLKAYIEGRQLDLDVEHIDASTPDGLEKAKQNNISSVPTVMLFNQEEHIGTVTDADELEEYL